MGLSIGKVEDSVIPRLRDARERIIVVSPWVSPETARLLVEKAKEGVGVELYTYADTRQFHVKALSELFERRREVIRPADIKKGNGFPSFDSWDGPSSDYNSSGPSSPRRPSNSPWLGKIEGLLDREA